MRTVYVDGLQNVLDQPAAIGEAASSTPARRASMARPAASGSTRTSPTVPSTNRARSAWRPRSASAPGPTRAIGVGGRSCGSRVSTGRAGSCAGRSWSAASRSPAIPDKFLNLIHIDDAARAAAAALDADEPEPIYLVGDDRPVTRREYYSRDGDAPGRSGAAIRAATAREPRVGPRRDQQAGRQSSDEARSSASRCSIPTSRPGSRRARYRRLDAVIDATACTSLNSAGAGST